MKKPSLALLVLAVATGCGTSSNSPAPDFTLAAAPQTVILTNGGPPQAITVEATAVSGFTGTVDLSLSGLPAGVTASPATVSSAAGQLQQIMLSASGAAADTSVAVTVVGTSGTLTHTAAATLSVTPGVTSADLSNAAFDFGTGIVGLTLTKPVATLTNTGNSTLTLNPTLSGAPGYVIVPSQSCPSSLAPGASCAETVSYTPAAASGQSPQTATLNFGLSNVPANTPATVTLSALAAALSPGTVTPTDNPQVALYSITLPLPGKVTVGFGLDTTYGRSTWSQSTDVAGGRVNILVAGMLPQSTYHMQASLQFTNGLSATDADHTFATKAPLLAPELTVATTPGMTPQAGVEELTFVTGATLGLVVTDLNGNVLWSYSLPYDTSDTIEGAKLLPNGDFLISIGQAPSSPVYGAPTGPSLIVAVREIDLAGNIVREISADDLTHELQAAGYNLVLQELHHDVTPLPNGHWLVLGNTLKAFTDLPGYPGVTNVLGDVVIDLDQNLQPAWVWNEFDHFDVNRHPMKFPDWTHTNAVVYSPSDGNLIVSMRHQNWVVKVDYNNGAGSGDVLWRLGEGGDFTLAGGTDPTDWQYAQHFPSLFTPNSSGVFSLGLMDNGDDRIFPAGVVCGVDPAPPCLYSTIPVFQIDETAKTATLVFHQILPPSLYSYFGGSTDLLANGNIEYDLAGTATGSDIFEVTPTATPQTVWHLHSTGTNAYRGYRIPSLYPGVQW